MYKVPVAAQAEVTPSDNNKLPLTVILLVALMLKLLTVGKKG
jgi:hypothetical protein